MSDEGYELPADTQRAVTGCKDCPFFQRAAHAEELDRCVAQDPVKFYGPLYNWGGRALVAPKECPLRARAIRVYLKP